MYGRVYQQKKRSPNKHQLSNKIITRYMKNALKESYRSIHISKARMKELYIFRKE